MLPAQIEAHAASLRDPESFWLPLAHKLIHWVKPPSRALSVNRHKWAWFPDGTLNTCFNCVDRHPPSRIAIQYDSPVTNTRETITYRQLQTRVETLAAALKHELNVQKGDTVIIYSYSDRGIELIVVPMIPEAVYGMLACARIGAIHSVVFGGFASAELAKRIEDSKAKVMLTASCGVEPKGVIQYKPLVDEALQISGHKPASVVVFQRKQCKAELKGTSPKDYDWAALVDKVTKDGNNSVPCEEMKSTDELYLLYTSGTTGKPKGIVRESGGNAVQLAFTMQFLFNIKPNEVIFCASDIGWVVGHTYIIYAPLLNGSTSVLYEGKPVGTPNAGIFWNLCNKYNVKALFTAPTALRAIKREDNNGDYLKTGGLESGDKGLKHLQAIFLAGERSEPTVVTFYQELLKKYAAPGALVIDNYWSTELGSPITSVALGTKQTSAIKPGAAGFALPGMDVRVVDDEGHEITRGRQGNIVLNTPLPGTGFRTCWKDEAGFQKSYFARFRGKGDWFDTGDSGMIDAQGYVHIMSRSDDIINVAAHRLSTGSMEEVIATHHSVAECCVVGMPDSQKGHVPLAFITATHSEPSPTLFSDLNGLVRKQIGGIATLAGVVVLEKIPKTRSGKTLRRVLREIVEKGMDGDWGSQLAVPATVEDRSHVDWARDKVRVWMEEKQRGGGVKARL